MTNKIFQVQIALKNSNPKIWRRVLIPSDLLLSDFHKVIQTTMGWSNSHLHQFIKDQVYYTVRFPDDDSWDDGENVDYTEKKLRVSDLLTAENETITYEYDFGDSWGHEIILEKILPVGEKTQYPTCLTGKRSCPPEDCGGVWGYADMLKILKHPDHDEYEGIVEWLGDEFDPAYFDKEEVNDLLRGKNYGCVEF